MYNWFICFSGRLIHKDDYSPASLFTAKFTPGIQITSLPMGNPNLVL